MGFFGNIGQMAGAMAGGGSRFGQVAGAMAGARGGQPQRYTQADFNNYEAQGDYGAAPVYDWEANQRGGWGGFMDRIGRTVASTTPGGMENYNRRMYLQGQMDLNDPQMSSIWQGRDDWQKDPGMVDEMWGDVNRFYGNPVMGGGTDAGAIGGAADAVKGAIKKVPPPFTGGHNPGMRHAVGGAKKKLAALKGSHSEIGGTGWSKLNRPAASKKAASIGQMAQASRESSYGG